MTAHRIHIRHVYKTYPPFLNQLLADMHSANLAEKAAGTAGALSVGRR